MPTDVEVEPATTADLEVLVDHWVALVQSQRSYGSHLLGQDNRSRARDVLGRYVAGDRVAVARRTNAASVAEESPLLGFIMFYVEEGFYEQSVTRGIIENVYVVPAARESGIGSALMAYAEAELAEQGADVAALSVMAGNRTALEFYRNRDYEPHRVTFERVLADPDQDD